MEFANFFVGSNEITKQFKGCYNLGNDSTVESGSLLSLNQCSEDADQSGASVFSLTNMNQNGLAQCSYGPAVMKGGLVQGVNESQCLKDQTMNTVYDISSPSGSRQTLGKTYLATKKGKDAKMVFHEYPSSLLTMGNQYEKYAGYDSLNNNLTNTDITDASSEQCKQFCINRGQECKGFVYDKTNRSCELKGDVYPTSKRQINKSKDTYTRMPEVKNNDSCPGGISAVSTDFLNKSGFLSSEQMSLNFQCETEGGLLEKEHSIDKAYSTLSDEVGGLRKENARIMKGFRAVRKDIKGNTREFNETEKRIKTVKVNPTVERMLMDSEELQTMFSMRNTGLAMALILFSLFIVRVLRK